MSVNFNFQIILGFQLIISFFNFIFTEHNDDHQLSSVKDTSVLFSIQ